MDTSSLSPSINLISDFNNMSQTIAEDTGGDKTRALADYFKQGEIKSQELALHTTDFEEKEFARLVNEAFAASRRIVLATWAKAHGSDLVC